MADHFLKLFRSYNKEYQTILPNMQISKNCNLIVLGIKKRIIFDMSYLIW
jgi:hypothetical protein